MSKSCLKDTEGVKTVIERHPDVASPCEASSTVAASVTDWSAREHTAAVTIQRSQPQEAVLITPTSMLFMATSLLKKWETAEPSRAGQFWAARAVEHDLESFYWVIIYVVYGHTMEDETLRATDRATHEAIKEEFGRLFSALNPRELAQERRLLLLVGDVLDPDGMQNLLEYVESHCRPLSGLLLAAWRALRECASSDADSKNIPESRIQEEEAEFAFQKEHGLPLPLYTPRSKKLAIPTIVYRRLCLSIQLMLERLSKVDS